MDRKDAIGVRRGTEPVQALLPLEKLAAERDPGQVVAADSRPQPPAACFRDDTVWDEV
jgi:hypothetical protein